MENDRNDRIDEANLSFGLCDWHARGKEVTAVEVEHQ